MCSLHTHDINAAAAVAAAAVLTAIAEELIESVNQQTAAYYECSEMFEKYAQ